MSGWKLFFCLLVGLFIEDPLMSADSYEPQKKIGVEIETSWLKVKHDGQRLNFSISSIEGRKLWLLEPDTWDAPHLDGGLYNLELKTYLGFDNQHAFLEVLDMMTHVLKEIYGYREEVLTPSELKTFLPIDSKKQYNIDHLGHGDMNVEKKPSGTIRPQITYQLSLSMIPEVFERLKGLGHREISEFWNALNNDNFKQPGLPPSPPKILTPKKEKMFYAMQHGAYQTKLLFSVLNKNFLLLKESKTSKNVKGMAYLFLYYWASLFNGKNRPSTTEPGLKPYLAVMSRIPLSQLYDYELNDHEKAQFQEVVGKVVTGIGDQHKLRVYINGKNNETKPTLTLKDWYFSIIGPDSHRQNMQKRLNDDEQWTAHSQKVDSLSPPPEFDRFNSMGLFSWNATQSPLIEVRGYATIFEERFPVGEPKIAVKMADDVNDFIKAESQWFFYNKEKKHHE